MLSPARLAQMGRLLDEALELDPTQRRSWLEALRPEDRDLEPALRQALSLEQSRSTAADQMATLPKFAGGVGTELERGAQPGERIGPYLLIRRLGEGGMGEVWLAQRADGAFKRAVALKLPILAPWRKELARRFARECDILASLEHANIARLYDAGVGAEGRPYLAMEYVAGEPLTSWCDQHRVGVRERLTLFLQVLDAVQYAHEHQVIHRDVKPSNILVTNAGQVRLLDFGVAKLLAHEDQSTQFTQLYGRPLTPEYASPELVRGDPIGVGSDVYSLGVVLYELLAGVRPYRLKAGASVTLLEQAIVTAQVERPSEQLAADAGDTRGMTRAELVRRLRGDLDAVVLKALAKAPAERYGSASAMADDLQRHLNGQRVRARPNRLSYHLAMLVLRHRLGSAVGAAALVCIAVLGFALIRLLDVQPAGPSNQARSRIATAASGAAPVELGDKSIAVLPFVDMSEKHDQEYFSDGLSEELIDRLSNSPDLRVISRTSSFYFKGKRTTIAEIAGTLHVSHVLEGSVRKAGNVLRISAQLIRASDGAHVWSQAYDRTLSDIFDLQGEIARTVAAALKAALNERASAAAAGQSSPEAYNLLLQGNYFLDRFGKSDTEKAIVYYQKALALDPNYVLAWVKVADAYMNLADNGWSPIAKANEQARKALRNAIRIDPDSSIAHRDLGYFYEGYDWDWIQAEDEYERAIALNPGDNRARISRAGLNEFRFAQFDEAITLLQQALLRDPLDTRSLNSLGWTLFYAGRLEESAAASRKLLELNPSYASAGTRLAFALLAMGRKAEALDAANKEPDEAWRLSVLPIVHWAMGRRAESDQTLRQLEQKFAEGSAYNVAQMYAYRGEPEPAFRWLERAYQQRDGGMVALKIDPLLRSLRTDPRYRALLVKMKLET
jgi:serine/threonine protein kinase/Flp pilus assembly protein TadD